MTIRLSKTEARLIGGVAATALLSVFWHQKVADENFSFADKKVLITGGSRGLGLTLARKLAQEGSTIIICARSESELNEAARQIRDNGGHVYSLMCDVTDRSSVKEMMSEIARSVGGLDVLINNAGRIFSGPFETVSEDDFHLLMDIHFWGSYYTMMEALPLLRKSSVARIANISSIGGMIGVPHLSAYSASKFALAGLSESLRAELYREGISLTLVCPGLLRTGSHRKAEFTGNQSAEYSLFRLVDALPGLSLSAQNAADKIISAIRSREPEVILGVSAKLAFLAKAIKPNFVARTAAIVANFLPRGTTKVRRRGAEIPISSIIEKLTKNLTRNSRENNEMID